MNIISSIMSKIFPETHPAVAQSSSAAASSQPMVSNSPLVADPSLGSSQMGSNGAANPETVDIGAILGALQSKRSEKLNWQTSIVDLMKLIGLDSSLASRKQLAQELNYQGDMSDSATMNIWLQDQVMRKFAENGGKVPESLKH